MKGFQMEGIIALVLLLVYTVCESIAYIPQVVKLVKTKSADDLSVTTWLIWVFSAVCYLFYVLLKCPEIGIIFISSLNLTFIVVVCILTVYYQNKNLRKTSRKK